MRQFFCNHSHQKMASRSCKIFKVCRWHVEARAGEVFIQHEFPLFVSARWLSHCWPSCIGWNFRGSFCICDILAYTHLRPMLLQEMPCFSKPSVAPTQILRYCWKNVCFCITKNYCTIFSAIHENICNLLQITPLWFPFSAVRYFCPDVSLTVCL